MLRFIEGFELYGGATSVPVDLSTKWTVSAVHSCKPQAEGRAFGYACELGSDGTSVDTMTTPGFGGANDWFVGFAVNVTEDAEPGLLLDVRSTSTVRLQVYHAGSTIEIQNSGGTELHTFDIPGGELGWRYFEFGFVVNSSSSSVAFRVDGVSVGSTGTITASGTGADRFRFYGMPASSAAVTVLLDDLYVIDTQDSWNNALPTSFLGISAIEGLTPTGDGTCDGTASAGDNYECVDDRPADGDTTFVTLGSGYRDLYTMSDLQYLTDVDGIQHNAVGRTTSTGGMAFSYYTPSTTEYQIYQYSFDATLTVSYAAKYAINSHADSSGYSTPWTAARVNALQAGPYCTS